MKYFFVHFLDLDQNPFHLSIKASGFETLKPFEKLDSLLLFNSGINKVVKIEEYSIDAGILQILKTYTIEGGELDSFQRKEN